MWLINSAGDRRHSSGVSLTSLVKQWWDVCSKNLALNNNWRRELITKFRLQQEQELSIRIEKEEWRTSTYEDLSWTIAPTTIVSMAQQRNKVMGSSISSSFHIDFLQLVSHHHHLKLAVPTSFCPSWSCLHLCSPDMSPPVLCITGSDIGLSFNQNFNLDC